jgi:hypothetical protein
MLRAFAVHGFDVEPIAVALEGLRPVTSVERWAAEYQPLDMVCARSKIPRWSSA